jgi:hypothetical protein
MVLTLEREGFIRRQPKAPPASKCSSIPNTCQSYFDLGFNPSKSLRRGTSWAPVQCEPSQTLLARHKEQDAAIQRRRLAHALCGRHRLPARKRKAAGCRTCWDLLALHPGLLPFGIAWSLKLSIGLRPLRGRFGDALKTPPCLSRVLAGRNRRGWRRLSVTDHHLETRRQHRIGCLFRNINSPSSAP